MKLAWALMGISLLCFGNGCSDSDAELGKGPTEDSGTGGTAGAAGTSGAGGSLGGGAGVGGAGVGGGALQGGNAGAAGGTTDPRVAAATYARNDISCTQDSDCCVVFDLCRNAGYVVGATDRTAVAGLLDSASKTECTSCIPPPVQVFCDGGFCKGVKIECSSELPTEAMQNHCNRITLPAGCTEKPQSQPSWEGPGLQPEYILGC